VTCCAADSHTDAAKRIVGAWLGRAALDFLFIDGDHSLQGALSDFRTYAPLVRAGGVVAFHDIVPDFKTRTGLDTGAYAGDVPQVWRRLKDEGFRTEEFVESWEQDGFGIGVVHWSGRAVS
jgi:predicted O-methyltransferase YrrM